MSWSGFLISKMQARVCVLAHARTNMKLGHASITREAEGTLVRIRLHRSQNDQKERKDDIETHSQKTASA